VVIENVAKLQNAHAQVLSQLESTICELDELKAKPSLLVACLECPKIKLKLDVCSLNVKKLETKLFEKSHVSVTSSTCELVFLSGVSLSMIPMRTLCSCKMLLISLRGLRETN
jgi:hypothetical protein